MLNDSDLLKQSMKEKISSAYPSCLHHKSYVGSLMYSLVACTYDAVLVCFRIEQVIIELDQIKESIHEGVPVSSAALVTAAVAPTTGAQPPSAR